MKRAKLIIIVLVALILITGIGTFLYIENTDWGFCREVSPEEQELRLNVIAAAEEWLDTHEGDAKHAEILEIYNTHEPVAQGYLVQPDDNWCATFGSAVAIQCGITDIVPTECGCQRQIALFENMGFWQENDNYLPLPGDYIFYAWDEPTIFGDCTGWADHVGIVVGTAGPFIKVIEGNKDDSVTYRIIPVGYYQIRGYGLPDYASRAE